MGKVKEKVRDQESNWKGNKRRKKKKNIGGDENKRSSRRKKARQPHQGVFFSGHGLVPPQLDDSHVWRPP